MGFIYKITNKQTGKVYIGQTAITIDRRWQQHLYNSYNHRNDKGKDEYNYALHRAIRKYGEEGFIIEVVEECDNLLLSEREKFWINKYNSYYDGYNETMGGDGQLKYNYDEIADFYLAHNNSLLETTQHFHIYDQVVYCALQAKGIDYKNLKNTAPKKKHNKKIRCVETGDVFNKITDIDIWLNKKAHGNIRRCLNGVTEKAYGYHWEEIDE